ncbi:hypothetical protein M0Q50_10355 [bacterium]|jgi:hypothetical protein|nr:hypothetical protein [bacterium]
MKTFVEYNTKEMEELFLQLAHLDELYVELLLYKYRYDMFYSYNGTWYFCIDKRNKEIWVNYDLIWKNFEEPFHNIEKHISCFFDSMLSKHMVFNDYKYLKMQLDN